MIVFDIETYRSDSKVPQSRRQAFDPAKNTVIAIGVFDGRNATVFPVIENLKQEENLVRSFFKKLHESTGSILAGYNILHFDIPYVVHKLNSAGQEVDLSKFRPLDLYWILPYWLQNSSDGIKIADRFPQLGKLWRFEDVVKHILRVEANPFSNRDISNLWEMKRFGDIQEHLERDLVDAYSLLELPTIKETMDDMTELALDERCCKDCCPFRRPLQKTTEKAIYYCTLLQHNLSDETTLPAVDVIDFPLPSRGISWNPLCRK